MEWRKLVQRQDSRKLVPPKAAPNLTAVGGGREGAARGGGEGRRHSLSCVTSKAGTGARARERARGVGGGGGGGSLEPAVDLV